MFNYGDHLEKLDFATTYLYILDGADWQIVPLLQEPIAVNYTIDESFDNAMISFLSDEIITKLENGTLVLLSYEKIEPIVTGLNKDDCFDVFVISKGEMTFRNGWGHHSYYLDELISLTKYMPIETLTFTSDTRVEITTGDGTTVYKQEPYNAMTILKRILATPTIAVDYNKAYSNDIILHEEDWMFTELIGVDDNFKDNTLYDALIKIGNYLDRLPILEFNWWYNQGSEYPYKQKYVLKFIKKETNKKYDLGVYTARANDIVYSDDGSMATSVVASVDNMIGSQLEYYPSKNQYAFAITTKDEDIEKSNSSDLRLVLPNPISEVLKLTQIKMVINYYQTFEGQSYDDFEMFKDSATRVVTEIKVLKYQEWLVQYDRENCAYYKENENEIIFGNQIKTNQGHNTLGDTYTHTVYLYNVEYYANNNPLIQKGEGLGEYFNQVDNMVDGGTFGRQLDNYQKANSGGDLTFSVVAESYDDILEVGDKLDDYIISKISFNTFKNNGATNYKVAYALNKGVARRNHFIKSNDGIRNYQTYYEGVEERKVNFKEDVNVWVRWGFQSQENINDFKFILNRDLVMGGLLSDDIALPIPMLETAVMFMYSQVTKEDNTVVDFESRIQNNITKSLVGDSVLLNIKIPDNTKAGISLGKIQSGASAKQVQLPVMYADAFGKIKSLDLDLFGFKDLQERFRLFITTPVGVKNVVVKRSGIILEDRDLIYSGDELNITANAATGYHSPTITTPHTVVGSVNTSQLIQAGDVISSKVTFGLNNYYEITEVKRTASALKGASIGVLSSGASIYYGDTLQFSAIAKAGYNPPIYNPIVNVFGSNININSLITAGGVAEYTLTIDSITGVKNIKAYTQVEVMGGMVWMQIQSGATLIHWNYIFFTAEAETGYNPPTITGSEMFPIQITGDIKASDYIKAGAKIPNPHWKGTATTTQNGTVNMIVQSSTPPPSANVGVWLSLNYSPLNYVLGFIMKVNAVNEGLVIMTYYFERSD